MHGLVQLLQACAGRMGQQLRQPGLPVVAVMHQRRLERRAVQLHKADAGDCVLQLHVADPLCVPGDAADRGENVYKIYRSCWTPDKVWVSRASAC